MMRELREKVPQGSQMCFNLNNKDYEAASFDQWLALIQKFQASCTRKGTNRAHQTTDLETASGATDQHDLPLTPWSPGYVLDEEEV